MSCFLKSQKTAKSTKPKRVPFPGIISRCFENFLFVYVEGQDKNLAELINQFQVDLKNQGFPSKRPTSEEASLTLSNAADLFLFFKKCMVSLNHFPHIPSSVLAGSIRVSSIMLSTGAMHSADERAAAVVLECSVSERTFPAPQPRLPWSPCQV